MFSFFRKKVAPDTGPKILFISSGKEPDYQCDMIFHGLKKLYGNNVLSSSPMIYMFDDIAPDYKSKLYGRGFTVYGNLDAKLKNTASPEKILKKIKRREFDKIVYGSIHRDQSFFEVVKSHYSSKDIIVIDGEDEVDILRPFETSSQYFKRELLEGEANVYPIQFCIPSEKILAEAPKKEKTWAHLVPGKLDTYIFKEEAAYYADYQKSVYAKTCKKAGWDCLRHYEIMASWCIPWFEDLKSCPSLTMFKFPKDLILRSNETVLSVDESTVVAREMVDHLRTYLTTEAMAKYVVRFSDDNHST